jgi:glycosyltransferase 2 family protein
MRKKLKIAFILIGILLFLYILYNVNIPVLFEILSNINCFFLGIVILIYFVSLFFRVLKWKWITNIISREFSFADAMISYLVGIAFSTVTPAKMGDVLRIFYVKKKDVEYGDAVSALIMDRIIDMLMLFLIGILALLMFSWFYGIQVIPVWIVALIAAAFVVFVIVIFNRRIMEAVCMPLIRVLIPERWKERVMVQFNHYFIGLNMLLNAPASMAKAVSAGLVSWILPFFYAYFMALALSISLPLNFFVVIIPIIAIIELLPVSISGIGTRDLALIYLFGLQGVSPEAAVAFSILYLFICYWMIGIIGILVWLKYPIRIDEDKDTGKN